MVNLRCFLTAYLASGMIAQIEVSINRILLILLGSLLGYWPKPSTSLEGGLAFKGGAFHFLNDGK